MIAESTGQDPPKRNIAEYKGRRFHAFSWMAPQTMRAELPLRMLRNLLGNPLKFVLAFGEDAWYVAVGGNGADEIKRVIDKSAETPGEKLPPLTASLALAPVWNFLASESRNATAAKIAESMRKSGNDRLKLTVEPVTGGMRYRIEGADGVNKLLAFSLGSAAGLDVSLDPQLVTDHAPGAAATTTTIHRDGATTTTTTRIETSGDASRTSRREVTTSRRSSSGKQSLEKNGPSIFGDPPNTTASGDKKQAAKPETALHTWSSKSGKFKIRARFIEIEDDAVRLENDDGDTLTVAIGKLSEADQKLARQLAQEMDDDPSASEGSDDE